MSSKNKSSEGDAQKSQTSDISLLHLTLQTDPKASEAPSESSGTSPYAKSTSTTRDALPQAPPVKTFNLEDFLKEDLITPEMEKALSRESIAELRASRPFRRYAEERRKYLELAANPPWKQKRARRAQPIDGEEDVRRHPEVGQEIALADAEFEESQRILRNIITKWEDGSCSITQHQYHTATRRLEGQIGNLLASRVTLRTSAFEFVGRDGEFTTCNNAEPRAYLRPSASQSKAPFGFTDTMMVARWQAAIFNAYGTEYGEEADLAWCPISQLWLPKEMVVAVHIVRPSVAETVAEHLFGPTDAENGHIWSIENAMPLCRSYGAMLHDTRIAIVPTKDGKDLMVTVLDPHMLEHDGDLSVLPSGRGLHGRILKFKTDHRPGMRYLYFNFAMNLLRRQRYTLDGWWKGHILHPEGTAFFSAPGEMVRKSTLKTLAMNVAYLSSDEAEEFLAALSSKSQELLRREDSGALSKTAGEGSEKKEEVIMSCYIQHTYRDLIMVTSTDRKLMLS